VPGAPQPNGEMNDMIAKYNGFCRKTNRQIIAGKTNLIKVDGQWQAEGDPLDRRAVERIFGVEESIYYDDGAARDRDEKAYEESKKLAAKNLHIQFPDVAAAKWLQAINASLSMDFGQPEVRFSSAAKEAAFYAATKNL
jgi:hypothetical protein